MEFILGRGSVALALVGCLGFAAKAGATAYQTAPRHISESRSLNHHIILIVNDI